jgi:hypothetical protein
MSYKTKNIRTTPAYIKPENAYLFTKMVGLSLSLIENRGFINA